jgi:hypothetical protein
MQSALLHLGKIVEHYELVRQVLPLHTPCPAQSPTNKRLITAGFEPWIQPAKNGQLLAFSLI